MLPYIYCFNSGLFKNEREKVEVVVKRAQLNNK